MAHKVTVNRPNVVLPNGLTYNTGDVVTLTDQQYDKVLITGTVYTKYSLLTDGGNVPTTSE